MRLVARLAELHTPYGPVSGCIDRLALYGEHHSRDVVGTRRLDLVLDSENRALADLGERCGDVYRSLMRR